MGEARAYRWFGVLAAAAMAGIFALTNAAAVALMMIAPFFLNVVRMIQYDRENRYIDRQGQSQNRAALLSVMNMGNSLLEIVFLLLSAVISSGQGNGLFLFAAAVLLAVAFLGQVPQTITLFAYSGDKKYNDKDCETETKQD